MTPPLSDAYTITTDRAQMQPERIHRWLSERSYWARGIPFDIALRSIENSFVIGAMYDGMQIGFARFITDYAIFAYLADVYVEEAHRGKGISKRMMQALMEQPWVPGIRRLMLATRDAHSLYAQYGFGPLGHPERIMEIVRPNIYQQQNQPGDELSAK